MKPIPVIDLFAGPGGLAEGFSAVVNPGDGQRRFRIGLSVEKDPVAHQTLQLRALFRTFPAESVPEVYYDYLEGRASRGMLFDDPSLADHVAEAKREAICAELGLVDEALIDARVRDVLQGEADWVLIGGPPCQAYSVVGRSRMRGADPDKFDADPRHLLYREYLRVIRTHRPAVFVMENVRGILSSSQAGARIFEQIHDDLSSPSPGLEYEIRSFVVPNHEAGLSPQDFLVFSENFGIPQARHRVILLGIRTDHAGAPWQGLANAGRQVPIEAVIGDLPPIRSRVSRRPDSASEWLSAVTRGLALVRAFEGPRADRIQEAAEAAVMRSQNMTDPGAERQSHLASSPSEMPEHLRAWIYDPRLEVVLQHTSRPHMDSDLHRYLFAASFAQVHDRSPKVTEFPKVLWPAHANVTTETVPFLDRFRVQRVGFPSSTILSHLSKDGHHFIHHDPAQCRSLTVREAARLQTFPDNYFFEGSRTQQYVQVGNAVPPLLARQLGEVVSAVLAHSALALPPPVAPVPAPSRGEPARS